MRRFENDSPLAESCEKYWRVPISVECARAAVRRRALMCTLASPRLVRSLLTSVSSICSLLLSGAGVASAVAGSTANARRTAMQTIMPQRVFMAHPRAQRGLRTTRAPHGTPLSSWYRRGWLRIESLAAVLLSDGTTLAERRAEIGALPRARRSGGYRRHLAGADYAGRSSVACGEMSPVVGFLTTCTRA